ncbi:hypothetical protein [Mechercharimyces sp. CAU 1602]|uniref:DUF7408 domain-containing protein n=1 Tax=Mechercharimyces sp. CAU 1602 TaxID=2973933 RepID=UPI0021628968|nr:hypothetical protein [Mechercharimyces sp. CAU 1602]MCS1351819.1 hypothetical protein [Mechercharimyces sp. CAU 1602]
MKTWIRKMSVIMVMVALLFTPLANSEASGDEQLELKVEEGFDGKYKEGWVPVKVSITNNSKKDLAGLLRLTSKSQETSLKYVPEISHSVELAADRTKAVSFVIPSRLFNEEEPSVQFIVGKEVIKEVDLIASSLGSEDRLVGIISDQPETKRMIKQIESDQSPAVIVELTPSQIPDKSRALASLDVIMINRSPEMMEKKKRKAIEGWVRNGGTLVVAGGQGKAAYKDWEDVLPVTVAGVSEAEGMSEGLEKWGEAPALDQWKITKATVKEEGEIVAKTKTLPLVAVRSLGEGKVFFAAYDLSLEPLVDWRGNAELWATLLQDSKIYTVEDDTLLFEGNSWLLNEALYKMPHLKLPSLKVMALIFLLYVATVGPLIYWVLSRFKKQVWMWGMIPLIGLVVTCGIYGYVEKIRGSDALVHQLGYAEIDEDGVASVNGVAGVVVPKSGDYTMSGKEHAFLWPFELEHEVLRAGMVRPSTDRGDSVTYSDVGHWAVVRSYIHTEVDVRGPIQVELRMKGSDLVGKVRNNSKIALEDAVLRIGKLEKQVGGLEAGEEKDVKIELDQLKPNPFFLSSPSSPSPNMTRKEILLQAYMIHIAQSDMKLYGWTKDSLYELEVEEGNESVNQKVEYLTLISAPITISPEENGEIFWPLGSIQPKVIQGKLMLEHDGIFWGRSDVAVLAYDLPVQEQLSVKELQVKTDMLGLDIEIFNVKEKKWVKVESGTSEIKKPANYVSPLRRIQIRISGFRDNGGQLPSIQVKGEVSR